MAVAQSTARASLDSITHTSDTPATDSSEAVVRRVSRSSSRKRDRTPEPAAHAAHAAPAFMSAEAAAARVVSASPPRRTPSRLRTPSVSTIREHEHPQRLIVTPATAAAAAAAAADATKDPQPSSQPLPPSPLLPLPQPSTTPPLPHATAVVSALTGPAAVSPALLLVPRPVRFWLWLGLYVFPLLLWLSASLVLLIAHLARSSESRERDGNLYFFRPEAPETSGDWVTAGWVAHWVSGLAQLVLLAAIARKRSPFFPGITLGSLLSLVLMSVAPVAHSNALVARNVVSPARDSVHAAVQLEWIALTWSLGLVIGLLLQAPRRIQMPLVVALRSKTNLELRAVLRQAQGDLAAAQAAMHQRLYGGPLAAAKVGNASSGNPVAAGQAEAAGYGLNTLARSQLKDILRSTRGQNAFASVDQQPLGSAAAGAAGSLQPNSARSNASLSSSAADEALAVLPPVHHRAGSTRRAHARRTSSLERAASAALMSTDSRDATAAASAAGGGKLSKLDRDMQKFSSAIRAASTAAAERQAESFSVSSLDAPVPSYMLEPPGSTTTAAVATAGASAGTSSMRSHRSSHRHRRGHSRRDSHSKSQQHLHGATRSHKKHHHGRVADSSAAATSNEVDFFMAARDELARPPTIEEQQALQRRILEEQQREREDREAAAGARWV